MNLEYINQLLQKQGIIWESCGYEDVDIKFDVTPMIIWHLWKRT